MKGATEMNEKPTTDTRPSHEEQNTATAETKPTKVKRKNHPGASQQQLAKARAVSKKVVSKKAAIKRRTEREIVSAKMKYLDKQKKHFEDLCSWQCTIEEISLDLNNTNIETLDKWCLKNYGARTSMTIKNLSKRGHTSLRRAQYEKAIIQKDTKMQIHLGMNLLGQSNKEVVNANVKTQELDPFTKSMIGDNDGANDKLPNDDLTDAD